MSRIGKQLIPLPQGVNVTINDDQIVVSGSKGTLSQQLLSGITITQEADNLSVKRNNDQQTQRANHGLMRSLINNMVIGVSKGYTRKLEINGVGYRASSQANGLKLSLGYSHDINYNLPPSINATIEQNIITLSGIDKQLVGQVASEIRALRKPEPYKGKGIKYEDEYVIRKSGKSGKEK